MFTVRYNLETGLLTAWDVYGEELHARDGERLAEIDEQPAPIDDDYENYRFNEKLHVLVPSGKASRINIPEQISGLEARVASLEAKSLRAIN